MAMKQSSNTLPWQCLVQILCWGIYPGPTSIDQEAVSGGQRSTVHTKEQILEEGIHFFTCLILLSTTFLLLLWLESLRH